MSDIVEINLNTGEVVERVYTQEEIDNIFLMQESFVPPGQNTEVILDPNKQSAITKLQSLGLTTDEAKAIVGI